MKTSNAWLHSSLSLQGRQRETVVQHQFCPRMNKSNNVSLVTTLIEGMKGVQVHRIYYIYYILHFHSIHVRNADATSIDTVHLHVFTVTCIPCCSPHTSCCSVARVPVYCRLMLSIKKDYRLVNHCVCLSGILDESCRTEWLTFGHGFIEVAGHSAAGLLGVVLIFWIR
jgi:hypothetical protein